MTIYFDYQLDILHFTTEFIAMTPK